MSSSDTQTADCSCYFIKGSFLAWKITSAEEWVAEISETYKVSSTYLCLGAVHTCWCATLRRYEVEEGGGWWGGSGLCPRQPQELQVLASVSISESYLFPLSVI